MWRWFVARDEELEPSTPHDSEGNYFFGPLVSADAVLRDRFPHLATASSG
jgi:hypothetical protein